jgi:hypothetical protein
MGEVRGGGEWPRGVRWGQSGTVQEFILGASFERQSGGGGSSSATGAAESFTEYGEL